MKRTAGKSLRTRKAMEQAIHLIFLLCGIVAVGFVLCISVYLVISGLPAIREIGLTKFLFGKVWAPTNATTGPQFGILPFILTSVYGTAGALLLGVVAIKLTAPDTLEPYRQRLLTLMGGDTDFTAAFSAVGHAFDGSLTGALDDAYTAVFGPRQAQPAAAAYTAENTPEDVCLTQQVLGFAYAAPVQGTVTDGFGWRENAFHYGTDIAADAGTVISSFADGTVTAVGDSSQLGNYVTVSHAGAFTTLYAHCSRITASSGQQVALGDPIAEVGETGNATGPHLHFAIQKDTVYLDPAYYGIG